MDYIKAVKASESVFKLQHCDWAKCTLVTDGTAVLWSGRGMNGKGRDCLKGVTVESVA